jgi:hypothetical protein
MISMKATGDRNRKREKKQKETEPIWADLKQIRFGIDFILTSSCLSFRYDPAEIRWGGLPPSCLLWALRHSGVLIFRRQEE